MPTRGLNRAASLFGMWLSPCGFIRGRAMKIVLRDRKRFENAYTCNIVFFIKKNHRGYALDSPRIHVADQ